jgi:chaperonin GroEL
MVSSKEIKIGSDVHDKLRSGVNKLASAVLTTMGPMGNTVIIANDQDEPYITKDGVSVSNYIQLEDPIENIAVTLLKQVAENTVDQAGDGTTTSICLAQSIINRGLDLIEEGKSYLDIKKSLDLLEEEVIFKIIKSSKELKQSNIVDIATISANNDSGIGQIIQDAYNHSNIVKVEEGKTGSDELITISGMQLETGYFDNAFINKGEAQAIEYEKPLVLLIDGKLESLDNISKLLLDAKEQPIVIIADYFSEQVVSLLKSNYNRGALNIALIKSPGFALHRKNLMNDIALYTGAKLLHSFTKYTNINVFGTLHSIYITKNKSLLTNETNLIEATEKLNDLKSTLLITTEEQDKYLLEQRITNLTGKIAIIRVGGKSEVEMKERKDRIEDAVLAVQSALEEGIVEGGGIALFRISSSLTNDFKECLKSPYQTIINNGAVINIKESLFNQNIIDPLKVTRCALQNAISVSKTLLSTKAIVLRPHLWK